MSLKYAILGFLSQSPLSGYDLKKRFTASDTLYWSGNNNQIYTSLVQLHKDGWVSQEVEYQESLPPRKVYSITAAGMEGLRQWVRSEPELPQVKNSFLVQLMWADLLEAAELDALLASYEEEVQVKGLMLQEQARRNSGLAGRSGRQQQLWRMIAENGNGFYRHELEWVRELRRLLREEE